MRTAGWIAGLFAAAALTWMAPAARGSTGPPSLDGVAPSGGGSVTLSWSNPYDPVEEFLGFSWDVYAGNWVNAAGGGMWHPFAPDSTTGTLPLFYSGGYYVWISSQYSDDSWFVCNNPWVGILYQGTPHKPIDVSIEQLAPQRLRLHWKPDIFGTWHYQVLTFSLKDGSWVETSGPSGLGLWQFAFFPQPNFLNGAMDLWVPRDGGYYLWVRGVAWDGTTTGEFGVAYGTTTEAWADRTKYLGTYSGPAKVTATIHTDTGDVKASGNLTGTLRLDDLRNIPGTTLYTAAGELKIKGSIQVSLLPYPIDAAQAFGHDQGVTLDRATLKLNYADELQGFTFAITGAVATKKITGTLTFEGDVDTPIIKGHVVGSGSFTFNKQKS